MISFDEVYAFRNYSEKYVCVLLDFRKQTPIDFLNSRREDRLLSYFLKIPLEERKNVKACSFDMYETYRTPPCAGSRRAQPVPCRQGSR